MNNPIRNHAQRNIGQFQDILLSDFRQGRFIPEKFAIEAGIDPATAQRYLKGTLPLPAALLAPLAKYTRNTAYLDTILDELGMYAAEKCEPESESSVDAGPREYPTGKTESITLGSLDFDGLQDEAVELITDAALLRKALAQWLDGPAKQAGTNKTEARGWWLKVVRRIEALGKVLGRQDAGGDAEDDAQGLGAKIARVAEALQQYGLYNQCDSKGE